MLTHISSRTKVNGKPVVTTMDCNALRPPPNSRAMATRPSKMHQNTRWGMGPSSLPPAPMSRVTNGHAVEEEQAGIDLFGAKPKRSRETEEGRKHGQDGVFTKRVGTLSNDFFVNLLSMQNEWVATEHKNRYQGLDRKTRQPTWTATRAQAEVYGMADGNEKFVQDFVKAWDKVMNADRLDIGKPADNFSQKLSA